MKRLTLILAACALMASCSEAEDGGPTAPAPEAPASQGGAAEGGMGPMSEHGGMMAGMTPAPNDSQATRGYKAAMSGMMENTPPYSGDADRDFMLQMRVHHQAAIEMARVELETGKNAEAKALAQQIVTSQQREIQVIDAWLRENAAR